MIGVEKEEMVRTREGLGLKMVWGTMTEGKGCEGGCCDSFDGIESVSGGTIHEAKLLDSV